MNTCNKCGSKTTRRRLCKQCGIIESHEGNTVDDWDAEEESSDDGEEEFRRPECANDCGRTTNAGWYYLREEIEAMDDARVLLNSLRTTKEEDGERLFFICIHCHSPSE